MTGPPIYQGSTGKVLSTPAIIYNTNSNVNVTNKGNAQDTKCYLKVFRIYNLQMVVDPTFQVANQVGSLSPHLLQYTDETVSGVMVQQPLPSQQLYLQ
jgi:hypothetical protein